MRIYRPLIIALALLPGLPALAAVDAASERGQLTQKRAEIEARFARDSQVCRSRFGVNACLEEARALRAAGLRPLEAREQQLDAEARRARSVAQRERVDERQREAALEEGRRMTQALAASAPAPAASLPAPRRARAEPAETARQQAEKAEKAEQTEQEAARNKARSAQRQQQQERHRIELRERQDKRAAEGKKPGAPLPLPDAAALAAAASAASAPRP